MADALAARAFGVQSHEGPLTLFATVHEAVSQLDDAHT